eukprot:scaffold15702_cov66-Phaeocystis_antarctica.AAC.10
MLSLLAHFSSSTIQPPCAPFIMGHAHLSSRPCMRVDLDFGDLNRPGVYMKMTGFKERFQSESARRVSVEEMTYCRDDDSEGCDLELLERLQAGRDHSGGTSSAAFG